MHNNIAEFLAATCTSVFTGAAIYITFVEHPARLECGVEIAAAEFGPSYRRAAIMQVALAAVACVSALVAWLLGSGVWWVVGGVLVGAVIPFTLVVIMPVNEVLLDPALDRRAPRTRELLLRWGQLHAVRSTLGAIALVLFLWLLAWR